MRGHYCHIFKILWNIILKNINKVTGLFQDFLISSVIFHSEGRKPYSPSLRMGANGKKYCITALHKIQTVKTRQLNYFIFPSPRSLLLNNSSPNILGAILLRFATVIYK